MKKDLLGLALSTALATALGLGASSAQAVQITSVESAGNLVNTEFTSGEDLAVDVTFLSDAPVRIHFMLDGTETELRFSSVVTDLAPSDMGQIAELTLDFGGLAMVIGNTLDQRLNQVNVFNFPNNSSVFYVKPLHAGYSTDELYFGDPLLRGTQAWRASLRPQDFGNSLTLTISLVPEPGPVALLLAGLAALGLRRQGRAGV